MNGFYIDGIRIDTSRTVAIRFEPEVTGTNERVELQVTLGQLEVLIAELEDAAQSLRAT